MTPCRPAALLAGMNTQFHSPCNRRWDIPAAVVCLVARAKNDYAAITSEERSPLRGLFHLERVMHFGSHYRRFRGLRRDFRSAELLGRRFDAKSH